MKIITFGNCQAGYLCSLLSQSILDDNVKISFLSSNTRTGDKKDDDEIIQEISTCDLLICQSLGEHHGKISHKNIQKIMKPGSKIIRFPYIFNSGISSLLHAPFSASNAYGEIYGKAHIISLFNKGFTKQQVIDMFKRGEIDFDLNNRFLNSLSEMEKREAHLEIKLSQYIQNNYKKTKLFITHNHPEPVLFYELIRKIIAIHPINIDFDKVKSNTNRLNQTNCAISPYDVSCHGYEFSFDNDWIDKGVSLIDILYQSHVSSKKYLTEEDINRIRDAAVLLESLNINMSYYLMNLALEARPHGPYIKNKVTEYKTLLAKNQN
jgi:hypothetical protein